MARRTPDETSTTERAARRVVERAMRVANLALKGRTREEIAAAFNLPQGEAPMWTHLAKAMGASIVRAESQSVPVVRQSLNVTIVQRADSNEEWLKMAEPYRRQIQGQPERLVPVVDVPAAETKKPT